jgi:hypothetical protein
MQFLARWGNACGIDFKRDDFCNLRKQWGYQRAYLEDRLRKPWVVCSEVNIAKRGSDMSVAIKKYDFASGSGSGSGSDKDNVTPTTNAIIPISHVTPLTQQNMLPPTASKSGPTPTPIPATMPTPVKEQYALRDYDKGYSDSDLFEVGGSREQPQEFDNKKELKEFIKMFKKQNKKSYKVKNSNTRRNKKNNK